MARFPEYPLPPVRVVEVQTISLGAATAGTVTLRLEGETTGALPYNANATTIRTALEALPSVDPGDVMVTGGFPGLTTVTFYGRSFLGRDVPQIVVTPTGLTGGTVTVATTANGNRVITAHTRPGLPNPRSPGGGQSNRHTSKVAGRKVGRR